MTSLFHFENKVHRRSLPRAESIPLLFPRLLCQVLEHIGLLEESRIERRQVCDVVRTLDRARSVPRYFHLQPLANVEADLAEDLPVVAQPSNAIPTEEAPPLVPDSPSLVSIPDAPCPTDPVTSTAPLPLQHIHVSPRNLLAIMDAVRTFPATFASFAAAQASLAERWHALRPLSHRLARCSSRIRPYYFIFRVT